MDTPFTFDKTNKEQCLALDLVQNTNISFFLTGCAGTGKTTFLQYIQQNVKKQFVLVAPTGIAALVAGGATIHSFFGMPWEPITSKTTLDDFSLNDSKWETLRAVDTIIIDEVSMVRCDMIDGIDKVLRAAMLNTLPFGGKQIIFAGDLYQLDPVYDTTNEGLVDFYQEEYNTVNPYFFHAHVFKQIQLYRVEFQKVYRQKDAKFLSILNHIRKGISIEQEIEELNITGLANDMVNCILDDKEKQLTLSAYNATVDAINENKLSALPEPTYTYTGKVQGKFNKNNFPAPLDLTLKEGARVMFVKNDSDHFWVNGSLGTVTNLSEENIVVALDSGLELSVGQETWEAIEYEYDKAQKKLNKVVIGSYTQYPLKLAWAITIHKSQGMTFDNVKIDLSRGVFTAGQLYVALSRVTSLKGLALTAAIRASYIRPKDEINQFMKQNTNEHIIKNAITDNKTYFDALYKQDYDSAMEHITVQLRDAILSQDMERAYLFANQLMDVAYNPELFLLHSLDCQYLGASNSQSMLINAIIAIKNGEYDTAIKYVEQGMKIQPSTHLYYLKSMALFALQQYKEAQKVNEEWKKYLKAEYGEVNICYLLSNARTNCVLKVVFIKDMQRIIRRNRHYKSFIIRFQQMMHQRNYKLLGFLDKHPMVLAFNNKNINFQEFISNADSKNYNILVEAILRHFRETENDITKL